MLLQPMFEIFDDVISSPALRDGNLPCTLPDGPTSGRSGQDRPHANRSRWPAKTKAKPTPAISGPSSSGSSESAALTSFLASKCRTQLESMGGSIEYQETWKERATPLGRVYWEHTAQGRRTSAKDCIGWPSPTTSDTTGGKIPPGHSNRSNITKLKQASEILDMAGWPSPKAQEDGRTLEQYEAARQRGYESRKGKTNGGPASKQGGLAIAAQLTGWATPMAQTPGAGNCDYSRQVEAAMGLRPSKNEPMAGWATPVCEPANGTPEAFLERKRKAIAKGSTMGVCLSDLQMQAMAYCDLGAITKSFPASTENRGVLDAAFSRWLMGFPATWDQHAPFWKEWDTVQKKLSECSGDREAYSRWLAEIALADSKAMATPSSPK